jgi:hypothetical protein
MAMPTGVVAVASQVFPMAISICFLKEAVAAAEAVAET